MEYPRGREPAEIGFFVLQYEKHTETEVTIELCLENNRQKDY